MNGWLKSLHTLSSPRMVVLAALVHLAWVGSFAAITEPLVHEAQAVWAAAIVDIGAQATPQESKVVAEQYLNDLYTFNTTGVVFKPTLAQDPQFRNTFAGALSYFVGQNPDFPQDTGFALTPWINVTFSNSKIILMNDVVIAGGVYNFEDPHGDITAADYTFVYTQVDNGTLTITAQHSSLLVGNDAFLSRPYLLLPHVWGVAILCILFM